MISLQAADVKDFMSKLLVGNAFDRFYICDMSVETFTIFQIGGQLQTGYYTAAEQEQLHGRRYPYWQEVRPFAYQIIRGKRLPLRFRLVLSLSDENVDWLLHQQHIPEIAREQVGGLYLNIRYENQTVTCVTGTSLKVFTVDRTLEQIWDAAVLQYLKQEKILVSKM